MNAPYPWQARQWQDLLRLSDRDRLGHALLFSGREGVGVADLALAFAHRTLCEGPSSDVRPCGKCRGCTLYQVGNHPDLKILVPVEEGKAIVIDQVRELAGFYALKSHYGRAKIVFICPADAMNPAAANALLKVLEEPPPGALLMLAAHRFSAISMTIRSRCIRVPCEQVDITTALPWLAKELPNFSTAALARLLRQAGGAPLTAQAIANSDRSELDSEIEAAFAGIQQGRTHALLQAKQFADVSLAELLRVLISLISRLILAKFGCRSIYDPADEPLEPSLQGLSDHLNLKHLYALLDLLFESKLLLTRQSGLREADIAEALWLGLGRASGRQGK